MCSIDVNKTAPEYFDKNFHSKYLMIDTCDCRNNRYIVNARERIPNSNKPSNKTVLCSSLSSDATLQAMGIKPAVENVFSLSDDYWDMCLQKFVALIKSKYDEENIIINEFCFADEYQETCCPSQYCARIG